jgi:translation initiation factor 2 alpha subunit (eIF-2alpha)
MSYYNSKIPILNETVFITVKSFTEYGTYCSLIEYDNIEGFVLNTELDRKVKDPKKQFEYNVIYPVLVLAVCTNDNKLTIDLSYKKINKTDREGLLEKFESVRNISKLATEYAFLTKVTINEVYEMTIRKFLKNDEQNEQNEQDEQDEEDSDQDSDQETHLGCASKLYISILKDPTIFTKYICEKYPEESRMFVADVVSRLKKTDMVIQQVFNLMILEEDAVTKLREFLVYPDAKIKYLSSPKYQIFISGESEEECDVKIATFVEYIKNKLGTTKHIFKLEDKIIITEQEYSLKFIDFEHYHKKTV